MEKKKLPNVYVKTCSKCGKEIIGVVENQVEYNYKIHLLSCQKKEMKNEAKRR